jgi:hypothetical protein
MKIRSTISLLAMTAGLALLAGCTPSYDVAHGGQSLPLVNPSFMSVPVQPFMCDTANVGYCPMSKPAS